MGRGLDVGQGHGFETDSESIACKGRWKADHTFVIDHHIVGDPSILVFELEFSQQDATMRLATLGMNAEIRGRFER